MGWGRNASIVHTSLSRQDTDILKSNTKNTWFVYLCTCVLGLLQCAYKTWFELSRVKLYSYCLKGNKNYFKLSRGQVTEGKITVNVWRKSTGNRF